MKYPMLSNWVMMQRLNYHEYKLLDYLYEDSYVIDASYAEFIKQLDGKTDPYIIDQSLSKHQVDKMIEELTYEYLIRTSRVLFKSLGMLEYTVWIPKWRNKGARFMKLLNSLLLISWLPIFILGCFLFNHYFEYLYIDMSLFGYILGLLIGIVIHELAHACAGIAYGAKVFEFGIGFSSFIPMAYTLMDNENCSKWSKIQIMAAGVEANFLITGLSFILMIILRYQGVIFFWIAINNIFMGFLNLLFIRGLDGMAIFSHLLGLEDIDFVRDAKRIIFIKNVRKPILNKGLIGYCLYALSWIVLILQTGLPILFVLNIVGVLLW